VVNLAPGNTQPDKVRLSARRVWKVYGPEPKRFHQRIVAGAEGADSLIAAIRETGHIPAACDITFDVSEGEIFVIMGLSGSGKSTIVRCLSRLVDPTAGEVLVDGQDILSLSERQLNEIRRRKMGMVFQHFGLLPHLTVRDNVAYPLRVQGKPRSEREARAQEMIDLVGLSGREGAFPGELSGGMQQRVGIARSLAVEPDIWFLDEPFSALDPLIRHQMQDEFIRLQSVLRKTIIFITHDFNEALRLADRIAIMRDGLIVQTGRPDEIVLSPIDDYVAEFTQDVPRGKVITAGSIAHRDGKHALSDGAVPDSMKLEDVIPRLIGRSEPLPVVDSNGAAVGYITGDDVFKALAKQTVS
jgi:glycine betaine/proline transport system ATP-binding protein